MVTGDRFKEVYIGWTEKRLPRKKQHDFGVCDRTFRRYLAKYEEEGMEGLTDKRLSQISHRRAPVNEAIEMTYLYKNRYIITMGFCHT